MPMARYEQIEVKKETSTGGQVTAGTSAGMPVPMPEGTADVSRSHDYTTWHEYSEDSIGHFTFGFSYVVQQYERERPK